MGVPIIVFWQSLIDTVVEVLVMGEDDMSSDIVELGLVSRGSDLLRRAGVQSLLWSHQSMPNPQGSRWYRLLATTVRPIEVSMRPGTTGVSTYKLVQAFGCPQTSRSGANDQNIH